MRWLVTGGAGFIGRPLVAALEQRGDRVVVLDVACEETLDLKTYCSWLRGSVSDPACLSRVGPVDVVVHLAAQSGVSASRRDPLGTVHTNVEGTLRCLELARECGARFIFASSGAVAGFQPDSVYGATKAAGELLCRAYATSFNISATVLRLSSVYGPGSQRKSSVVAAFCKCALRRQSLPVRGDGQQTREFVYVDDVVAALLVAANRTSPGTEPFAVTAQQSHTVLELAEQISKWSDAPIHFEPPLPGELLHAPNQAPLLPGWEPSVSWVEGLERTWRDFQASEAD